MIKTLLTGLLLMASYASAKPACNADGITRNCAFFMEHSKDARITLSDGTSIPNPRFKHEPPPHDNAASANAGATSAAANYGYSQEALDESFQAQSEIMDSLSKTNLSSKFKMSFIMSMPMLFGESETTLSMPWPPNEKNALSRPVKSSELNQYLQSQLSPNEFQQLKQRVLAASAPARKQMLAFQQEQLKQQADQAAAEEQQKNELAEFKQKTEARKNHVRELFKYAKEQAIAVVTRGKPEALLTADEKIMIKKLETVELRDFDEPGLATSPSCMGTSPNAFYAQTNHKVSVCPNALNLPDATMLFTLAHELGHSIDPCQARMPLWKVNQEKLSKFISSASRDDALNVKALKLASTRFVNFDLSLLISDETLQAKLVRQGVLEKFESGIKTYPFQKEFTCLEKQSAFLKSSPSMVQMTRKAVEENYSKEAEPIRKIFDRSLQRFSLAAKKFPECLSTIGPASKMSESMSDLVASVVTENYLLENPPKTEAEKITSLLFIEKTCEKKDNDSESTNTMPKSISPVALGALLKSPDVSDPHATLRARLEKIQMNLPGYAKMYDCERKVPACFDHLSFSNRTGASGKPSENNGGTR